MGYSPHGSYEEMGGWLMLPFFVFYVLSYVLGLFLVGYFNASRHIVDYSEGALVMFVSILVITWAWNQILMKKAIALAVSVIVLKYIILVFVLHGMAQNTQVVFFALGVSVFIPAILAMVVKSVFVR